jgi:hypothetical protein
VVEEEIMPGQLLHHQQYLNQAQSMEDGLEDLVVEEEMPAVQYIQVVAAAVLEVQVLLVLVLVLLEELELLVREILAVPQEVVVLQYQQTVAQGYQAV